MHPRERDFLHVCAFSPDQMSGLCFVRSARVLRVSCSPWYRCVRAAAHLKQMARRARNSSPSRTPQSTLHMCVHPHVPSSRTSRHVRTDPFSPIAESSDSESLSGLRAERIDNFLNEVPVPPQSKLKQFFSSRTFTRQRNPRGPQEAADSMEEMSRRLHSWGYATWRVSFRPRLCIRRVVSARC